MVNASLAGAPAAPNTTSLPTPEFVPASLPAGTTGAANVMNQLQSHPAAVGVSSGGSSMVQSIVMHMTVAAVSGSYVPTCFPNTSAYSESIIDTYMLGAGSII